MKLSELVDYLNLLNQDATGSEWDSTMNQLWAMQRTIFTHSVQFGALSTDLKDDVINVQRALDQVARTVDNIKDHIVSMIAQLEPEQYEQSQRLYQDEMCHETAEYILNRQLHIDNDSDILLRAHLKNFTDWRLPGLIIRPGLDTFIEDLVPLDPLYLVDHNMDLLQPAVSAFTPEYQRRLRPYTTNDYAQEHPLWQLPDNQFGFVFAWNYFNYKPLSVIYRYLDDIYTKLRPGGVVIFTYNDCDYGHGAALAERNFMCYTPGKTIKSHAQDMGFEIIFEHSGQGNVTWLELKKPGEIQSIRGGQALAKIVAHQ
jgi:hypothetical protein